jgi:hypothetical protein
MVSSRTVNNRKYFIGASDFTAQAMMMAKHVTARQRRNTIPPVLVIAPNPLRPTSAPRKISPPRMRMSNMGLAPSLVI